MRIEKPTNGLYQAKLAQDQIEVVSSDLVSSTGALNSQITIVNNNLIAASSTLDTKIDSSLSKLRVRALNSVSSSSFFSTTNANTIQFVTGSNTIYTKKYSDTELRVSVLISVGIDLSTTLNSTLASVSYSTNSGGSWSGTTILKGATSSVYMTSSYLVHFNLGVIPSGSVDFRIGVTSGSTGYTLYVRGFSYQFIEAMENA